jgi:hypothetical protein
MGAEYTAVDRQIIQPNGFAIFTAAPVPCTKGFVVPRLGSGLFQLSGLGVPRMGGCCCNRRVLGVNYDVDFGANIAVPEGETVGEISVGIALGGTAIPSSIMTVTPAAVEQFFNISRDITAQIVAGCCQTVAIQNLSKIPIAMVDASINFDREGVSALGVI